MTEKISPARQEKQVLLEELVEKMKKSCIAVLTDYRGDASGLSVKDMNDLRKRLRQVKGECKVIKNTLVGLACKELKIEGMDEYLVKPTALILGYGDPVETAKVIYNFAKGKKASVDLKSLPSIKAGYLDGKLIDESGIKMLANLPSREVLYAIVVRTIQAPISGFVNILSGLMRNLVYSLEDLRKKKAEEAQ